MDFDHVGLSPDLVKVLESQGYARPTALQLRVIPLVLDGNDLVVRAGAGSGRTAAFVLPLLQRLAFVGMARPRQVRAMLLAANAERAIQVHEATRRFEQALDLRSTVAAHRDHHRASMSAIALGVDLLVCTPHGLTHLLLERSPDFRTLELLVLDEASSSLAQDYAREIEPILNRLPRNRQTLALADDFSEEALAWASPYLADAIGINETSDEFSPSHICG